MHSIIGFGTQLLAPLAARYRERCPDVQLDLSLSQRQPDLLEEGHDVVITLSRQLPDSELIAQRIGEMFCVVCASPDYLREHGVPDTPEDLVEHRCLHLVDPAFPEGWVFREDGVERTIRPAVAFQVNVAEAIAQAATAGMGICLLPDFAAAGLLEQGRLVRLLPRHRLHEKGVYALYPSRRFLDAKVKTWSSSSGTRSRMLSPACARRWRTRATGRCRARPERATGPRRGRLLPDRQGCLRRIAIFPPGTFP